MATEDLHIETTLLHGAYSAEQITGATVPPLFQSTSFARRTAEELESVFAGRSAGYVYTRINNPTLDRFERRMTALEDGLASVSCASGMAAISTAVKTFAVVEFCRAQRVVWLKLFPPGTAALSRRREFHFIDEGTMHLEISRPDYSAMLAAAHKAAPCEACGLLAGRNGKAVKFYELTNADASPEHFSMDPAEQFAALKDMRANGLEMLAAWHSHPATPARMSAEDLRRPIPQA